MSDLANGLRVSAGRLWAGGIATTVIAGLIAVVGIFLARGLFDVPVLAPQGAGVWGDADTVTYALVCAFAAVVATGLLHLLLLTTPRPLQFFGWIITLATLVAAAAPFVIDGPIAPKVATAVINIAVGAATGTLLTGVGTRAVQIRRPPGA
ncbi:hypothetical protein EV649_7945 [Kribbella sp. VKM Ac-2569]|uniref:DUF6069 family protein n=1 Tax=Kribbella sp. VKM Ac-2569 TaxID=2512220 RepID=UPI00102C7523|nr:DUF6069 family protein [Kribbella sp. VKM Ac-2569]RZT07531.1 hypothetical protein EV649_7945 [Kribbella sp. VKM Ac-2569]